MNLKNRLNLLSILWLSTLTFGFANGPQCFASGVIPDPGPQQFLNSWSWYYLDSTNFLYDDAGQHGPLRATNVDVNYLGDGAAVALNTNAPSVLEFKITESDGTNNFSISRGSWLGWFAPGWTSADQTNGTGPGNYGRIFETGYYTTNASVGFLGLFLDPAGETLIFAGQTNNGNGAIYATAPVSFAVTNQFNMITVTWSSTNASIYLNGVCVTNGPGIAYYPSDPAASNSWRVGSDITGLLQAKGSFDDIFTFSNVLSTAKIAEWYDGGDGSFTDNPLNAANIVDAPFNPTSTDYYFDAFTGIGNLVPDTNFISTNCIFSTNVWFTNVVAATATNGGITISFVIAGGSNNVPYDLFATTRLASGIPANAQWHWQGQVNTCHRYSLTNVADSEVCLILGTTNDADADGLSDAYELLVSKTDPNNPETFGTGVADWWQWVYFGTNVINPFAFDSSGDGWTLLEDYQKGWAPGTTNTSPPPRNVSAVFDSTHTNVVLNWESGGGPVASYAVLRGVSIAHTNGASIFSWQDSLSVSITGIFQIPSYTVRAYFPDGSYADAAPVSPGTASLGSSVSLARGPNGGAVLILGQGVSAPELSYVTLYEVFVGTTNIYATNFVGGIFKLPPGFVPDSEQCFGTNGAIGQVSSPSWQQAFSKDCYSSGVSSGFWFSNAARHLKENLRFYLRSASVNHPFSYILDDWSGRPEGFLNKEETPLSYDYSGFHIFSSSLGYSGMQELRPIFENYFIYNFVPMEETSAWFDFDYTCSSDWFARHLGYSANQEGPTYGYAGTGTETNPAVFVDASNNSPVFFYYPCSPAEIGLTLDSNTNLVLAPGAVNAFGLPIQAIVIPHDPDPQIIWPGATGFVDGSSGAPLCWISNAAPSFAITNYYFASETPYLVYGPYTNNSSGWAIYGGSAPPLPGAPSFSITNTSPLLFTGVGQQITVSGWAKVAISNGFTNRFGYLEQYFDKAFKMDSSGNATTNQTGVLSPYGEFFPTEPGPTALVTLPDVDSPYARGTGVVNVLKLQLDVNHDGVMDQTWTGPDNTSPVKPFVFWLNNDHDEPANGDEPDRDLYCWGNPPPNRPDYSYGQIRCQRNLEDFARLWLCGLPALPANQGYSVQLGWSSVSSGSPRIRLYLAAETNGGIGYLTNTTVAAQQISQQNLPVGEVTATSSLTLPTSILTNAAQRFFLFEAGGAGKGQLTLTVSNGTNKLAQTSAWLDLHDVFDLYESAIVTNVIESWPDMVESDPTSGFRVFSAQKAGNPTANELAVFIHGWRMSVFDWGIFSETMFKRFYWQGYQGKFASLQWPTRSEDSELFPWFSYITYNRSEHIAFKSGSGAAGYLNNLRGRYTNFTISACAHSMGGIVAMQTMKELSAAGQKPLNNVVLMQAAVPASCFDPSATNYQTFLNGEALVPTPDTYRNYASGITNALSGTGKIVNFFNPDDFALFSWNLNEGFYNANLLGFGTVTMKPNTPLGYYTDGTNSTLRPNDINQNILSLGYLGYYGSGPTRAVTNLFEILAFVARPRTLAVGESVGIHGQIQGQEVDLESIGFTEDPNDHSGQFQRNIQETMVWPFYTSLRTNLFPNP